MSSIPKKVLPIRANPQQVSILREAFSQHMPQDMKRLATETGLTEKWISGWFQRERRKLRTKNVPLMKEEYEDPSLAVMINSTSEDKLTTDSEALTDTPLSRLPKPPRKKARTLRKKRSLIIKMENIEDTLPLEFIPACVPSARVLSGHSQSCGIANSRDQVHTAALTSSKPTQPPKRRRKKQKSVLTSKATTNTAEDSQLKDARLGIVQHAETLLQILSPIESRSRSTAANVADLKGVPESASMKSPTKPLFLGPLLLPRHMSQSQSTETAAINFEVVPKPTLSDPSIMSSFTPLFPLPGPIHSHLQSRQALDATPLSHPHSDHVQRTSELPLNNCDPKLEALPEVLNPNLAPLKHLTVLRKRISNGSLSMSSGNGCRNVMEILLDERLTSDDPFQAAMGLVFLSRLAHAARET